MSIWPVRLAEWFPFDHECHEITLSIIKAWRCRACGKRVKFNKAIGHHSLPWGHGDLWCSWKCCNSGKIAKQDKRWFRRIRRKFKKVKGFTDADLHCQS